MKREERINDFKKVEEKEVFEYYPIDEKWKIPGEITLRKPKEGMIDYKINFIRIGKIDFVLERNPLKLDLYKEDTSDDETYYIYLKDATSGKTSYGLGRFVPVIKENEKHFLDFNLAFTPACGHIEGSACPWARESTAIAIEAGEKAVMH
jgi:uncharacterized protein (DUF1684 family)